MAQAVEAGEISVDLLRDLYAEFEAACERPQEESQAIAIQHIAEIAQLDEAGVRSALEAIEAQPKVMQQWLMRRFVEAWLEGQRKVYHKGT